MTDRDTFAAAALTGLLAAPTDKDRSSEYWARFSYEIADAMLAVRDSRIAKETNHDAAPAARASVESVASQPTTRGESARTDKAVPQPSEGTGDTLSESPNLVSADYRESVAIKYLSWLWAGDSTTDVAVLAEKAFRLADEELARHAKYQCSDRSQPVKDDVSDRSKPISDERLAALEELSALDQKLELEYGLTGNPLIKARRRKAAKTGTNEPRNGAISDGPDPDSRVLETQGTPTPHTTPPQGSVPGEGSVPDSRTENEPVAWAVEKNDWPPMFSLHNDPNMARRTAMEEAGTIVPLYRRPQPTLTDEEREAVEAAIIGGCEMADTLRKLLERTK